MSEVITAHGHPGITARHQTTFMITKDREVGPRGDCIVAVGADKAGPDLSPRIKDMIRTGRELLITVKVGGVAEKIRAQGSPSLTLDHPSDLVVRKSRFVCGRTLAIRADKAAADFSRKFVAALRDPAAEVSVRVEINAIHPVAYSGCRPR